MISFTSSISSITSPRAVLTDIATIVEIVRGELIDQDALLKLITDGDFLVLRQEVFEREPALSPRVRLARAGKVGAAAASGLRRRSRRAVDRASA